MKLATVTRKDPKIQTCAPSLLKHQGYSVHHEHEVVVVTIGNADIKMDYPTAIKLSQMLYAHGKQAKKFAGDFSRQVQSIAVLTDAEQHERMNW